VGEDITEEAIMGADITEGDTTEADITEEDTTGEDTITEEVRASSLADTSGSPTTPILMAITRTVTLITILMGIHIPPTPTRMLNLQSI